MKDFATELKKLGCLKNNRLLHPVIETHCHLDYLKKVSAEILLSSCQELGVEKLMTISVTPENLNIVLDLTKRHESVYGTQGIHPHHASSYNPIVHEMIKENANNEKIVAIGEIGLDYYYNHSTPVQQRNCFERLLQLAIELSLPVVIHTRDADQDTLDILKNFPKTKGVIHSFTSGIELAEYAIEHQLVLGINGICTFKNAINVAKVIELTPIEHIILETDAPFLTPTPFRGEENNSLYLPFIVERVGQLKKIHPLQVLETCHRNTLRLFNKLQDDKK